jgi:putative glutamine amidotransferase
MTKPIIGITTGRRNVGTPRNEMSKPIVGIPMDYPDAVVRSGGAPVLLPREADADVVRAVMGTVDALLLSGGGDVVSLEYGEEPHPTSKYQDPIRDAMEIEATRVALERGIPILGICRGIQLLNVAMGGTLVQDVPSQVPKALLHYNNEIENVLTHTIAIEPDSILARVLGETTAKVNSWHHQSVKDPAPGLRVTARACDGVVEALEAADARPILTVQCHPEACCKDYPFFQKIFDWIVEEARKTPGS